LVTKFNHLFFSVPWGFGGIIVAVVGTEVAVMKQSPKSDRVVFLLLADGLVA